MRVNDNSVQLLDGIVIHLRLDTLFHFRLLSDSLVVLYRRAATTLSLQPPAEERPKRTCTLLPSYLL